MMVTKLFFKNYLKDEMLSGILRGLPDSSNRELQ